MIKSLFYKEWIKTKKTLAIGLILSLGWVFYPVFRIHRLIELKGADQIWTVLLMKDTVLVHFIAYLPVVLGLTLALIQYGPEMQNKRLKLTLHLPINPRRIILIMLSYGYIALSSLFALHYIVLGLGLYSIFPSELMQRILLTTIPWYLAGFLTYTLTAWMTLEVTWKGRLARALFTILLLYVFFLVPYPEAYNRVIIGMILGIILFFGLPYLSILRFKAGKQD